MFLRSWTLSEANTMKNHRKKMAAPLVITAVVVVYYLVFFLVLTRLLRGPALWLSGLVPLGLAAVMIGVCVQRIKEIRSGEEDDLGKY